MINRSIGWRRARMIFAAGVVGLAILSARLPAYGGSEDTLKVLRMIPADVSVAAVVADFEKVDRWVNSFAKRVDPGGRSPGILDDIKGAFGNHEWMDFSSPVGLVLGESSDSSPSILVRAPEFAEKIQTVPGATQEAGVWHVVVDPTMNSVMYAKQRGDYVALAPTKTGLERITKEGKSLADRMQSRTKLLRGRDALIHVNMDQLRDAALSGIAQMSQMAPMIAMMAGAQMPGGDPMVLSRVISGSLEGVEKFVEQLDYVDILISLEPEAGGITILSGYKDGPIKSYLAKQKPASVALLSGIQAQPYVLAAAYHMPGKVSAFYDYIFEKMLGALRTPPATGTSPTGEQPGPSKDNVAIEEAMRLARELYGKISGMEVVMAMSADGITAAGGYSGHDAGELLDLTKQYMTKVNPLMSRFGGGMSYESLGARKIGSTEVHEFALTFDKSNPAGAALEGVYGRALRYAFGITDGRLRFSMGDDKAMARVFGARVSKPFADGRYVKEALAKLPQRRNAVVLFDPAGFAMMASGLAAGGAPASIPPGPPIAVSVSLSGEPVRVDIHVPMRSIERMMQAAAPNEPM